MFFTSTFWKVLKKTEFVQPLEADLIWKRPATDAYEATIIDPPKSFGYEMIQLVGIGKRTKKHELE